MREFRDASARAQTPASRLIPVAYSTRKAAVSAPHMSRVGVRAPARSIFEICASGWPFKSVARGDVMRHHKLSLRLRP